MSAPLAAMGVRTPRRARLAGVLRAGLGRWVPVRPRPGVLRALWLACLAVPGLAAVPARAQPKVLRVVPQGDVVLLDPLFGTAAISNIAGMMV